MNIDQLEKLLSRKTPAEVVEIAKIPSSPVLQLEHGYDMTNIAVDSIPGAVKFCLFENAGDQYDPSKFATGYVVYVNGPMSPMYRFTEQDFTRLEKQHGPVAVAGLRNTRLLCKPV